MPPLKPPPFSSLKVWGKTEVGSRSDGESSEFCRYIIYVYESNIWMEGTSIIVNDWALMMTTTINSINFAFLVFLTIISSPTSRHTVLLYFRIEWKDAISIFVTAHPPPGRESRESLLEGGQGIVDLLFSPNSASSPSRFHIPQPTTPYYSKLE